MQGTRSTAAMWTGSRVTALSSIAWLALAAPLLAPAQAAADADNTPSQSAAPAGTSPAAAAPAVPDQLDTITVTGTRIRGVAPVGSPLIPISPEDIQASGLSSTGDVLNDIPQILSLGSGNSYYAGTTQGLASLNAVAFNRSPNLRGFGPQATLSLVNGHRVPYEGANMNAFDGDDIPAPMLKSLEVVADGTSPIYGADAIAGTVNYVLRDPFDGAESDAQYGSADGQSSWQVTESLGHTWDTGGFVASYQHTHFDPLLASARPDLYNDDFSPYGGPPSTDASDPGNVLIGGTEYGIPRGQNGSNLTLGQLLADAGKVNRQNIWDGYTAIPQSDRDTAVANFKQRVVDGVELFGDLIYSNRDYATDLTGPNLETTGIVVPNTNYYSPCNTAFPSRQAGLSTSQIAAACGAGYLTMNYNLRTALGGLDQERAGYARTGEGTIGAHVDLPFDWVGTISYEHGDHDEYSLTDNYFGINSAGFAAALAGTTAATAFNPFCDGSVYQCNSPSILAKANGAPFLIATEYAQSDYSLNLDGPVLSLPGGDTRLALGSELYRGAFTNRSSLGITNDGRHITSGYAELYVPIFGAGNALPLIQSLELDVAGRIDEYSDVGETDNPKVGFNWTPIDGLKVHGSFGTSFRAPSLLDNDPATQHIWLYNNVSNNSITPSLCPSCGSVAGGNVIYQVVGGADRNLKPETSRSDSIGGDWKPEQVKGLDIGLNYWRDKYLNQVNTPVYNAGPFQAINQQYYNNFVIYNPTYFPKLAANNPLAFFGNFPTGPGGINLANPNCAAAYGKRVTTQALYNALVACIQQGGDAGLAGPPFGTVVALEDGHRLNSGLTIADGLDLNATYSWDSGLGIWTVGGVAEYILTWNNSPIPSAPIVNEVNHFGYPLQFKGRAQLGWQNDIDWGHVSVNAFVNYTNGYKMDVDLLPGGVSPSYANISAYTTVDLALAYTTKSQEFGTALNDVTFTLSVQNLFNEAPPLVLNSGALGGARFDPSNASPLGTVIQLQLSKKFDFGAEPAAYAAPPTPPPAPPAPPAPAVAIPEPARSFEVFFDFDKSDITGAAARVIEAAADAAKAGHAVRLTVTGHTDTVGSQAYNLKLSERRAEAVRRQLVSDGIESGEITTLGVGKNGLLVPTGDGVREPQNRRAEIVLQ